MKCKRVIIAGSRWFNDYYLLETECDKIFEPLLNSDWEIEIVSGKAKGADTLGEDYTKTNGFKIKDFFVD